MTTMTDSVPPRPDTQVDRPFATGPVLGVAAVAAVVLLLSATRYGYFGDELYFLAAGRRLSSGYADQGPVLPLLAAWGIPSRRVRWWRCGCPRSS
ncbi:hypothetical protein [Nocardia sp. NPDC002869]|uniref:hypothetical protein n=1 Tax=Nocardia sp. NPDC002869 TaxID=3161032 RepID=UPI00398CA71D